MKRVDPEQLAPEVTWRRFRRTHADMLARMDAQRDALWKTLRARTGLGRPALEHLRESVPWPGLLGAFRTAQPDAARWALPASVWLTWRDTGKRVYRLTPELAHGLREARWPAAYPAAHFRPPVGVIFLELPDPDLGSRWVCWHTAMSTNMAAVGGTEVELLRLDPADGSFRLGTQVDATEGVTLSDAIERTAVRVAAHVQEAMAGMPDDRAEDATWWRKEAANWPARQRQVGADNPVVRLAVNALLYILGNEDIVEAVHPGARPHRRHANPQPARGDKHDLAPPTLYTVGTAYSRVIERWAGEENREGDDSGQGGSRSMRPHLRSAHAHLYWTGAGRTTPIVKFLPPIPVKGGADPDGDAPSVWTVR